MLLFLIAHVLNCIFFIISENGDNPDSWIQKEGYVDNYDKYTACFYYIFTTLTTTGYGDILPSTLIEVLFTIVIVFCGVIIFSVILSYLNEHIF
jgi:hypothetical protein